MRKVIITLLTAVGVFLGIAIAPAQAATTGYFALNSDNEGQNALVRDSWGLLHYEFLYPGEFSERGMVGIMVPEHNRIKFKSLATGAIYWTACGEDLGNAGYYWRGSPYYPVSGRSVQILDDANYPNGVAAGCTGF